MLLIQHPRLRAFVLGTALSIAFLSGSVSAADEFEYETLFDVDSLVQVEITIDPADWDTLRSQNRSMVQSMAKDRHPDSMESPFTYFKADVLINGVEIKDVGIRKKGFLGSLDRNKPSLKIHFKKFKKGRKISGLEKLTLNNNKQDPSAMNQVIAYRVFRDAGLVAPLANHALVKVNGKELGIYSHVESIDADFIKRHFDGKPGSLYEGTVTDFALGWADKLETKLGKKGDYSDVEAVIKAVAAEDDELLEELGKVLDLEQFYDFWAVEVLLQHWDGYAGNRNNFLVYRPANSSRFVFIPWGADSIAARHPFWQFTPPASVYAGSTITHRLYNHSAGREQYRKHFRAILDKAWNTDELLSEIERIDKLIGEHMKENGRYANSVETLKEFVSGRSKAVLAELNAEAPTWETPLADPVYVRKGGTISGTFSTTWGTLAGNPFAESEATMIFDAGEDSSPAFSVVSATAGPSEQAENKGDPSLRIAGRTDGSPKMTMINFGLQPHVYGKGVLDIDLTQVFGMALEIDPSGGGFNFIGLLQGTINLKEAGAEKGEKVSGSFEADLMMFNIMGN